MKSEDLLRVIGDIDESYIAEADSAPVSKVKRWRRYTGWIITAAAAVLVILISVKLLRPVRKSEQLSSTNTVANAVTEDRTEKEKTAAADYDAMEAEVEEATDYDVVEEAAVGEIAGYNAMEEAAVGKTAGYDVVEEAAVEEEAAFEAPAGAETGEAAFEADAGAATDAAVLEAPAEAVTGDDDASVAAAGAGEKANEVYGQRYTFEISSTREADTAEQGEWLDLAGKHILIEREGEGIRRARWENASGTCTLTAEGEPFTREELEKLVEELT